MLLDGAADDDPTNGDEPAGGDEPASAAAASDAARGPANPRLFWPTRLWLAVSAVGLLIGFAIAACLTPDPSGQGTHQQLGLPPCSVQIWLGVPCPSCGLTTSITHVMHGELAAAYRVQPVGVVVALAAAIALVVCGEAALRGRWRLPISPLTTAVIAIWTINVVAIARWLVFVVL